MMMMVILLLRLVFFKLNVSAKIGVNLLDLVLLLLLIA
jgi:hypothetical protein